MAKLHEMKFNLLLHPPCFQDMAPSNYYLFADLKKKMLEGKRIGSNGEVISEIETYFEGQDNSYYRKGIEM